MNEVADCLSNQGRSQAWACGRASAPNPPKQKVSHPKQSWPILYYQTVYRMSYRADVAKQTCTAAGGRWGERTYCCVVYAEPLLHQAVPR